MRRLREAIRQKLTELQKNQSWILHHDNATSMLLREIFVKNKTVIMPQPPYSPDLASADFSSLFPKLKTLMKWKHFAMIEEIKEKSKQGLVALPKSAFQSYFVDCKNAGISVLYLRGVNLKGTRQFIYNYKLYSNYIRAE